jgi:dihydrofolate synthase/folylpolyglutamate synthase
MERSADIDDAGYRAAIAELFARRPERMVPGLDRMRTLLALLGEPERSFPSLQVTGTNGKTTTTGMISCLLGALGLAAGGYTSPHLQDVRERIRVATKPISRAAFAERLSELAPYLVEVDARSPERVTFFEALTALAIVHFADTPVEVGVFEVGMGGRWDATNLVRGEVAVLTTVGLDHPELGATIGEVAQEKAGIIKDDAVVVSAAQDPSAAAVIAAEAERRAARLVVAGRDFAVTGRRLAVGGQELDLRGVTGAVDGVFLPLHGAHQAANAACALAAVEGLFGFSGGLNAEVLRQGFAAVRSPGRLEVVRRPEDLATVVLDGAHNPGGARALAEAVTSEFAFRTVIGVLGVLDDKDVEAICAELAPAVAHLVVTEPPSPRAASAERVAKAARAAGLSVEVTEHVGEALDAATGLTGAEDGILVTGSLYTVGAARDALRLPVA